MHMMHFPRCLALPGADLDLEEYAALLLSPCRASQQAYEWWSDLDAVLFLLHGEAFLTRAVQLRKHTRLGVLSMLSASWNSNILLERSCGNMGFVSMIFLTLSLGHRK